MSSGHPLPNSARGQPYANVTCFMCLFTTSKAAAPCSLQSAHTFHCLPHDYLALQSAPFLNPMPILQHNSCIKACNACPSLYHHSTKPSAWPPTCKDAAVVPRLIHHMSRINTHASTPLKFVTSRLGPSSCHHPHVLLQLPRHNPCSSSAWSTSTQLSQLQAHQTSNARHTSCSLLLFQPHQHSPMRWLDSATRLSYSHYPCFLFLKPHQLPHLPRDPCQQRGPLPPRPRCRVHATHALRSQRAPQRVDFRSQRRDLAARRGTCRGTTAAAPGGLPAPIVCLAAAGTCPTAAAAVPSPLPPTAMGAP